MIAILGAMDKEVAGLIEMMDPVRTEEYAGCRVYIGRIAGREVAVEKCGIGKVNAAIACRTLILMLRPDIIINTGVGGSLTKELGLLNIAVGNSCVQHDMDNSALGDPIGLTPGVEDVVIPLDSGCAAELLRSVERCGLTGRSARIASGDRFISSAEDKKRLRELFGAEACDEEGAAVAQTCFLGGTKCAVLRAISDATDEDHQMEYTKFASLAAQNAIRVAVDYIEHT